MRLNRELESLKEVLKRTSVTEENAPRLTAIETGKKINELKGLQRECDNLRQQVKKLSDEKQIEANNESREEKINSPQRDMPRQMESILISSLRSNKVKPNDIVKSQSRFPELVLFITTKIDN